MSKLVLLECRIQQLSERLPAGFDVALRILERFIYIDKKKSGSPLYDKENIYRNRKAVLRSWYVAHSFNKCLLKSTQLCRTNKVV